MAIKPVQEADHRIDALLKYASTDPIWLIHAVNLDLKLNHIYLQGEESYIGMFEDLDEPGVEYSMANKFIKNINILMRKTSKPILVHMKTTGGSWIEGMAIYDTIKACPNKIIILNYAEAVSMSSIILQAAYKRVMMPHSSFMLHEGSMGGGGTVKQYLSMASFIEDGRKTLFDIYVNAMQGKGQWEDSPPSQIRKWIKAQMDKKEDVWLTPTDAVKYGLADSVFGADGKYDWKALVK